MSRTLALIQTGWDTAVALAEGGRKADALAQLARLLARPDVPADIARQGHRLAGTVALDLGRFAAARKHLRAAAALDTTDARTRYLAGRAWEEDPDGCDRRAALWFRKATLLDGTNPLYRAAFGRAAARCGKVRHGVREMLAAADQEPGAIGVVRVVVSGLLEMGKAGTARRVLAKAQFLRPGCAELAALGERTKFELARVTQRRVKARDNTRYAQDAPLARDGDRVLLPFVRIATGTGAAREVPGGAVRTDVVSFPRPHLGRLRIGKADR
jgi:hypothetical protein